MVHWQCRAAQPRPAIDFPRECPEVPQTASRNDLPPGPQLLQQRTANLPRSPMSFISCPPFDDSLSVSTIQKSNSTLASFPPVHVTRLVEPEHSIVYDCPVTELWTLIDLLPLVGIAVPVA